MAVPVDWEAELVTICARLRRKPGDLLLLLLSGEAKYRVASSIRNRPAERARRVSLLEGARVDLVASAAGKPTASAYKILGYVLTNLDEYDAAHVAFEKALECSPTPQVLAALASSFERRNDEPSKRAVLESHARDSVAHALLWVQRLHSDGHEGNFACADALAAYERALTWFPGEPALHRPAGREALELGEHARAVEHLGQALERWSPVDTPVDRRRRARTHRIRAKAFLALGRIAESDADESAADTLDPRPRPLSVKDSLDEIFDT